jgi:hypothetical protein
MKSLRIILAAFLALTLPATGQTIKSLGYNTTNGVVVYFGTNELTFTNAVAFGANADTRIIGSSVLFNTNTVLQFEETALYGKWSFLGGFDFGPSPDAAAALSRTNLGLGLSALTNNNVTNFRTAIGLGATNSVTFSNLAVGGAITTANSSAAPATNSTLARGIQWSLIGGSLHGAIYGGYDGAARISIALGTSNSLSDVATFRSSGMTIASNAIVNGTLTASNLTVNGTLTAASIATSTPVSWSLDAVQTAADTNGVIDLPLNANVLRITNANTISAITNGRLGAFYYIVNQSGTNLVLSNSATLTTRGGGTVTLAPNQSATLLSTSATNATLQGGPSQLDSPTFAGLTTSGTLTATGNVTMSGTANTAPNQTAASGSSVMTRDLGDARYGRRFIRVLTNSVSAFSATNVNSSENLVVPAGNYAFSGALFVSTDSTNSGVQAEIVPSNVSADTVASIQLRGTGSNLNGASATPTTSVRSGSNLFQYICAAFADAPTKASWSTFSGTVNFSVQQTNTFRVRQRSATDSTNAAIMQVGSFIEFVEILP